MSIIDRSDPHARHRFEVDFGTGDRLGFTEVRGLSVSVEIIPEDETGETDKNKDGPWWDFSDWFDQYSEYLPAPSNRRTQSPNLELRRGLTDDTTLWDWLQEWVTGSIEPRDVNVILQDNEGQPVRGWRCHRATPVEWTGPELIATRSDVATETLELAHEGLKNLNDMTRWE